MSKSLPPHTRRCARCGEVVTTWLSRGNGPDYCLNCLGSIDPFAVGDWVTLRGLVIRIDADGTCLVYIGGKSMSFSPDELTLTHTS